MKIALPTRDGRIDDHFGHCESYTIVEIDDNNNIISKTSMPSPEGCGCKSNIANQFETDGITLLIGGNMGQGALNKLNQHGVKVIRGCKGNVDDVLADFLEGKITDSGITCSHHNEEGHECGGHHHTNPSEFKVIL
jgi:predicted Fe-Mo cluster-binding NifX family protein